MGLGLFWIRDMIWIKGSGFRNVWDKVFYRDPNIKAFNCKAFINQGSTSWVEGFVFQAVCQLRCLSMACVLVTEWLGCGLRSYTPKP